MVYFEKGTRNDNNKIYKKLRSLHYSMKSRCYDPSNISYKSYGAKGVTVADEWLELEDFLSTIDTVVGYDEDALLKEKLQLDKDTLIEGNKVYSPETCCFITAELNGKVRPNQQKWILAISPFGERHRFKHMRDFASKHGLLNTCIANCLIGRANTHKDWVFMYEKDGTFEDLLNKYERKKVVLAYNPLGDSYKITNIRDFSKKHNLNSSKVYLCLKGERNHHKKWKFVYEGGDKDFEKIKK